MAPGVAAARLQKLHVAKLPNWNCELPHRGSFGLEIMSQISFESRQAQQGFAGFAVGIHEFHHEFMFMTVSALDHMQLFSCHFTSQLLFEDLILAKHQFQHRRE